jgi:hypothetical protein
MNIPPQGPQASYAKPSPNFVQVTKVDTPSSAVAQPMQAYANAPQQTYAPQNNGLQYTPPSMSMNGGAERESDSDSDSYVTDDGEDSDTSSELSLKDSFLGDEEEDDESELDEQSGGAGKRDSASEADTSSTVSTTEILGRDPLFLVLSEFLMDDEGNNIVHVLSSINKNLSKIAKALSEQKEYKKKNKSTH